MGGRRKGGLNEASISSYQPQTNVTDKNGGSDTPLDRMLDNSLATAERERERSFRGENELELLTSSRCFFCCCGLFFLFRDK